MKFNLMKEELSSMLENLKEQFESMDAHEQNIPQIEMDIFIRNIQKLYEDTIYLKRLNETHNKASIQKEQRTEIKAGPIEIKQETSVEVTVEEVKTVEEKATLIEEAEAMSSIEIIEEQVELKEMVVDVIRKEPILDEIVEKHDVEANLFSDVKASKEISDLNKKLADARNTHSIVEKLQNHRIENLKSVIGINDKFYFINELFGGDTQKYEDIIYTLNNFKKLEDAMQYFSTLKYRFNWDEESEPFAKLVHMLERKFDLIDA